MKTIVLLQCALAVLLLAALRTSAATPPPNATGRHLVAFASNGQDGLGQRGGLFVMRDDGTQVRQLTRFSDLDLVWSNNPRNPLPDDQPSISPDGRRIAFTSNRSGNFDIWVMDINGGNLKQLTTSSARDVDPAWSPDGQFLAFASDQGSSELKIWQMRADGSQRARLTIGDQQDVDPAWHPNGGTIAFSRKVGLNNYGIFILRRASPSSSGFTEVRLTDRGGEDRFPAFFPSGNRLVYTSERAFDLQFPYGHIVSSAFDEAIPLGTTVNLTDDNERLGDFRRGGAGPAISPDGAKVVGFHSDGILITSKQQLMRLATTGGRPTAATPLRRPFDLNINPSYGWEIDTDGDGKPDFLSNPNGLISPSDLVRPQQAGNNPAFGSHLALPDLNHDGFADIAILVGDFNQDGVDDLAVGAPGQNSESGAVYVLRESGSGLDSFVTIPRSSVRLPALALPRRFGYALAAGDFDGDGRDELVVGIPNCLGDSGAIAIYDPLLTQNVLNEAKVLLNPEPAPGAFFGAALQVGDFSGDGVDDLAISAPGADKVWLFFGLKKSIQCLRCPAGLNAANRQALVASQFGLNGVDSSQLPNLGSSLIGSHFPVAFPNNLNSASLTESATLAAGDIDQDGRLDLVIGVTTNKTTNLRSRTPAPSGSIARLVLLAVCALSLGAQAQTPLIRSGSGTDAAAIRATVDQFRADLGRHQVITWDGVPAQYAAPNFLPADFFNSRGALLTTPGAGVQVSAASSDPGAAPVRFGHINSSYPSIFKTFSAERLFSPIGSATVDLLFLVPGTQTPAVVKGFGAVYADADIPDATSFEYFDAHGNSLGKYSIPTWNNGLSFLGVSFDRPVVRRVRIVYGNAALGPDDGNGTDVAVMDDFIYGEPEGILETSIHFSQVEVCWNSTSNLTYQVQYRSDLTTNRWASLIDCVRSSSWTTCIKDPIVADQPRKYYRVVQTNCVSSR